MTKKNIFALALIAMSAWAEERSRVENLAKKWRQGRAVAKIGKLLDEAFAAGYKAAEKEVLEYLDKTKSAQKKLADEYRDRYNKDKSPIARNSFYHCVIAYNEAENLAAEIEGRSPVILCFSNPPVLTEEMLKVQAARQDAQK